MKYLTIEELTDFGLLQEINRQFLHPLGYALEVTVVSSKDVQAICRIQDHTDDPEGVRFDEEYLAENIDDFRQKYINYMEMMFCRQVIREQNLGFRIQPLGKNDG